MERWLRRLGVVGLAAALLAATTTVCLCPNEHKAAAAEHACCDDGTRGWHSDDACCASATPHNDATFAGAIPLGAPPVALVTLAPSVDAGDLHPSNLLTRVFAPSPPGTVLRI